MFRNVEKESEPSAELCGLEKYSFRDTEVEGKLSYAFFRNLKNTVGVVDRRKKGENKKEQKHEYSPREVITK